MKYIIGIAAIVFISWLVSYVWLRFKIAISEKDYFMRLSRWYGELYNNAKDKMPYYSFILGNIQTGSVWTMQMSEYPNLKIGEVILLDDISTDDKRQVVIKEFGGMENNYFTIYVEENLNK